MKLIKTTMGFRSQRVAVRRDIRQDVINRVTRSVRQPLRDVTPLIKDDVREAT